VITPAAPFTRAGSFTGIQTGPRQLDVAAEHRRRRFRRLVRHRGLITPCTPAKIHVERMLEVVAGTVRRTPWSDIELLRRIEHARQNSTKACRARRSKASSSLAACPGSFDVLDHLMNIRDGDRRTIWSARRIPVARFHGVGPNRRLPRKSGTNPTQRVCSKRLSSRPSREVKEPS